MSRLARKLHLSFRHCWNCGVYVMVGYLCWDCVRAMLISAATTTGVIVAGWLLKSL